MLRVSSALIVQRNAPVVLAPILYPSGSGVDISEIREVRIPSGKDRSDKLTACRENSNHLTRLRVAVLVGQHFRVSCLISRESEASTIGWLTVKMFFMLYNHEFPSRSLGNTFPMQL